MLKKVTVALVVLIGALGLAACGGDDGGLEGDSSIGRRTSRRPRAGPSRAS